MRVTRRAALKTLALGGMAAAAGLGSYGYGYERRSLSMTRLTIPVAGLPVRLQGLRIGLMTDLHFGSFLGARDLSSAARLLRDQKPDLIVLGGDYVTWSDRKSVAPCAAALAPLAAPLGIFAVTGNHDPEPTVNTVFRTHGIQVLRDEDARVVARGEPLTLGGLRYWTRKPEEIEKVFKGASGMPVLLAHDPRRLAQASALGLPLLLSGHTHGGQVVLPGVGAPAAARFPVVWGLAREGPTSLFVSRGIGTVLVPLRLNCPPEIAVLTLTRA
jgi:predicted MPP superfamily phosphohydrolase